MQKAYAYLHFDWLNIAYSMKFELILKMKMFTTKLTCETEFGLGYMKNEGNLTGTLNSSETSCKIICITTDWSQFLSFVPFAVISRII
jgi:hypothetical protein